MSSHSLSPDGDLSSSPARRAGEVIERLASELTLPIRKWEWGVGPSSSCGTVELFGPSVPVVPGLYPQQRDYAGYRWYRARVELPSSLGGVSLRPGAIGIRLRVRGRGEVTVNGRSLGSFLRQSSLMLPETCAPGDAVTLTVVVRNRDVDPLLEEAVLFSTDALSTSHLLKRVHLELFASWRLLYWDTVQKTPHLEEDLGVDNCRISRDELTFCRGILHGALAKVDLEAARRGDEKRFGESLKRAEDVLLGLQKFVRGYRISLAANAHIDLGWLWRVGEASEIVRGTFRHVVELMERFPELCFSQSQVLAYAWLLRDDPVLFKRIKERVENGQWELVGGMWVEPDCNLISGESWARQLIRGQGFFQEHFGRRTKVGWNPDSFGYTWSMPQFYREAGIEYFVFTKLSMNEKTVFPHHLFWWEGPDGSRVLAYFFHHAYNLGVDPILMLDMLKRFEVATGYRDLLYLYGVGDHGGGPTAEQVEAVQELKRLPVFPRVEFARAEDYFERIPEELRRRLPVWKEELYLETHQGTFTTQRRFKEEHDRVEAGLISGENAAAAAQMLTGERVSPPALEAAWEGLFLAQFHDILCGTSIPAVYQDSSHDLAESRRVAEGMSGSALSALAGRVGTDTLPEGDRVVLVFNPLAWKRSGVVELPLPEAKGISFSAVDAQGNELPLQEAEDRLLVSLKDVPPLGYSSLVLREAEGAPARTGLSCGRFWMENEHLRVKISPETGEISSLRLKGSSQDLLSGPGNQLLLFVDEPRFFEAWNMHFTGKRVRLQRADEIELVESGPVRAVIRVKKSFRGDAKFRFFGREGVEPSPGADYPSSFFRMDYVLYAGSPLLHIVLRADWWEERLTLKTSFPVREAAPSTTYEIPHAAVERGHSLRKTGLSPCEVPALRWAHLRGGAGGLSLIAPAGNHGFDRVDDALRLTLLRSPTPVPYDPLSVPDPCVDRGLHRMEYALFPHPGDWSEAGTPRRAWEFHHPLLVHTADRHPGELPPRTAGISVEPENVILSALEPGRGREGYLLRLYESCGKKTRLRLSLPRSPKEVHLCDILGKAREDLAVRNGVVEMECNPFQIATLEVLFG